MLEYRGAGIMGMVLLKFDTDFLVWLLFKIIGKETLESVPYMDMFQDGLTI